MKLIVKNHTGKGYKSLITIHKRNGSYNDTKDDNSKIPPVTIRSDILKDLLVEQGYICAYCMRKIDEKTSTIEHIIGQGFNEQSCDKKKKIFDYTQLKFERWLFIQGIDNSINQNDNCIGKTHDTNYKNMLAVCCGNSCHDLHCDKSRAKFQEKRPILFISPLNKQQMENIKFSQTGIVYYKVPDEMIDESSETEDDKEIRADINKILNLNCEKLREDRGRIIKSIKSILRRHDFKRDFAKKEIERWQNNNGHYKEFCQVAIYELQKHIK